MLEMSELRGDERSLDNLYAWIDTIPLSRPKRNISRDFADGVLVAEVVSHFLPKLVELHNYCSASSWSQKKINWQTLNRRVFSKIGMRVGDDIISQLIDAKPGVIEQVLWDLRTRIEHVTCTSDGKLNIQRRSKSNGHAQLHKCIHLNRGNSLTSYSGSGFKSPAAPTSNTVTTIPNNSSYSSDEPQLTYRVLNSINSPARCKVTKQPDVHLSYILQNQNCESPFRTTTNPTTTTTSPTNNNNTNSNNIRSSTAVISSGREKPGYISPTGKSDHMVGATSAYDSSNNVPNSNVNTLDSPGKESGRVTTTSPGQFGQGFLVKSLNHQGQGYIAPPSNQLSSSTLHGSSPNGPIVLSPVLDKQDNNNVGGPPAQIIYRGHKMIPLQFLDDKEKEIKALETSNRTLTLKIHRLESLVNVKDQRIEDLTHQLQNLRSMYERITDTTYDKI